jgi:hypothetical protein
MAVIAYGGATHPGRLYVSLPITPSLPAGGIVTTILPFARPCSTEAIASSVSSNGNVRSSTGRSVPAS